MNVEDKEILFIYNHNSIKDREALGYVVSLKHYKIKEFDITKEYLTRKQLVQLADKLGVNIHELVNDKSDLYIDKYQKANLDKKGILKVLEQFPTLLKTPIAVYKDSATFIESTYEHVKKDMSS